MPSDVTLVEFIVAFVAASLPFWQYLHQRRKDQKQAQFQEQQTQLHEQQAEQQARFQEGVNAQLDELTARVGRLVASGASEDREAAASEIEAIGEIVQKEVELAYGLEWHVELADHLTLEETTTIELTGPGQDHKQTVTSRPFADKMRQAAELVREGALEKAGSLVENLFAAAQTASVSFHANPATVRIDNEATEVGDQGDSEEGRKDS